MSEYKYPLGTETGKTICQVCGKEFFSITAPHLKTHGITLSEYKFKYPDAPITGKHFTNLSLQRPNLFVKEELEKIEKENTFEDDDSEPIIEDEITFIEPENIEIKNNKPIDIFADAKEKVLDHLRIFLTNVKKDYLITEYTLNKQIIIQTITDFADPILKVDIEFPKAFWHNKDRFDNIHRDNKLKECGWKVIKIDSVSPTYDDIKKIFSEN